MADRRCIVGLDVGVASPAPPRFAGGSFLEEFSKALRWQLEKVPSSAAHFRDYLLLLAHGPALVQKPQPDSPWPESITKGMLSQ